MDAARADILWARSRLAGQGWIGPRAEDFRHLPPPPAAVWLGDGAADACQAPAAEGSGWTLRPIGAAAGGAFTARWLDAQDPAQRAELRAGLPSGAEDPAAPFDWAHRALCRHGLRLRIGGADAGREAPPVWLQLDHLPRATLEAPLLVIEVDPGMRCVLVETHDRASRHCGHPIVQNLQVHLRLGDGASVQHLRVVRPLAADRLAHHIHLQLGREARYAQALLADSSAYHLQRQHVVLAGAGAQARCATVAFAAGGALDQQIDVGHAAERSVSEVRTLVLAGGQANVVANARARIAPGSRDAAVLQRLSGIPTGGRPRIVLRPHLEILHDQVRAAHGATWGALPADALFYASQRGLDDAQARALVIEGLARDLLERTLAEAGAPEALALDERIGAAVAAHLAASAPAPTTPTTAVPEPHHD